MNKQFFTDDDGIELIQTTYSLNERVISISDANRVIEERGMLVDSVSASSWYEGRTTAGAEYEALVINIQPIEKPECDHTLEASVPNKFNVDVPVNIVYEASHCPKCSGASLKDGAK